MEIGITTRSLSRADAGFEGWITAATRLGFRGLVLSTLPEDSGASRAGLLLAREHLRCWGAVVAGTGGTESRGGGEGSRARGGGLADRLLSARDADRHAAVAGVRAFARAAREVGAARVLLPAMRIPGLPEDDRGDQELASRFTRGEHGDRVARIEGAWAARRDALLDALCRSLHALLRAEEGTRWCLITRRGPGEFPDLEGLVAVLEELHAPRLGYWHDAAHACRLGNLGLERCEDWLDRLGSHMEGIHLRDCLGVDDGKPAGTGEVDFRMVRESMASVVRAVADWSEDTAAEERRAAMLYLAKFDFRPGGADRGMG